MSWFKLKRPMDENSNVDFGDIVNAKQALRQIGYYQPPVGNEIGTWVDPPLFDGIRKFQKDNRLKVDGVMKPGGPTETAINQRPCQSSNPQDGHDDQNKDPSVVVPPNRGSNMPVLDQHPSSGGVGRGTGLPGRSGAPAGHPPENPLPRRAWAVKRRLRTAKPSAFRCGKGA